jgi:carboxyl-terminal processing protease
VRNQSQKNGIGEDSQYLTSGQRRPFGKFLLVVITAAVVFTLGFAAGHGNLSLRSSKTSQNLPSQIDYSSVNQVYKLLKQNFDGNFTQKQVLDGIKAGLVNSTGDPYTEYFNTTQAKEFDDQLRGSFTGIGAELGKDSDGNIIIIAPLSGYPAKKAGLKPKDIIASVNKQSTSGQSLDSVVQKIRGPSGTNVTLSIIRGGGTPFDVTIKRAQISVASVEYHEDGAIGYLKISQFGEDTVKLAQTAAKDFKSKGVKAVVLDLRGDPGGYLNGAVDVSSLWLEQGKTVVSERRGSTVVSTEYSNGNDILHGLPTVVLVDGGSASASEITAGALHDNGAATLVGAKSFGKGSVQQVLNLPDGAELKVTIAHWYTPNGKNIDKQGIDPDITVAINDSDASSGKDPQKDRAYQILQQKIQ